MGSILPLGITHYPPLSSLDVEMSGILKFFLADPDVPDSAKDPANWPAAMRVEWSDDHGLAAAARHRAELFSGLSEIRRRLDEFEPDVVVIWGDDQYENFREDVVPAFSVLAYDDLDIAVWPERYIPNHWGEDATCRRLVRGQPEVGRYLADQLLARDFDVAYAYERLHDDRLAHAFLNAVTFLDHERTGFDYPVVPFQINCYGRKVISARGGFGRIADSPTELDPRSPSPRRCFDLGVAAADALLASPWKVALVASSSWSHAFLVDKHWRLRPDTNADRALYDALIAGDYDIWREYPLDQIEESGQQEVLNWSALAGSMHRLGATIEFHQFNETHIFNSNKCFLACAPVTAP